MMRLFPVFVPARVVGLLVSEILLICGSFILASYFVFQVDPADYLLYDGGLVNIALVLMSILIGLYLQDLYSDIRVHSKIVLLQQLCLAIGVAFLIEGFIAYLDKNLRMPARMMAWGSFLTMAGIFVWRSFYSAYLLQAAGRERLLFVGGSSVLLDIARHIQEHPEAGLMVAGYVDDVHPFETELPGGKILGTLGSLREIVTATRPDRIVVGMFERRQRVPVTDLLELRLSGHIIEEAATVYERVCGRVCIKELRPSHLIYSGELGPRRQMLVFQDLFNMSVAAVSAVVSLPFMLLTAVAVKLSSPGPVLYRQMRVGLDGAQFTLFKFRSMYVNAEAETGAVWASPDDPRVTWVGRVIRRLRLDELPQLFNVLRGEMSIVGPRPERPEFVKALSEQIPYYRQRNCVRPGITGWAQINYKYGDTLEDTITKLEYDLFYIKNLSFRLDTYVIFHTVKAMMLSRGAQ
jgi:sugar transferase (PEP-CTERM system associated)